MVWQALPGGGVAHPQHDFVPTNSSAHSLVVGALQELMDCLPLDIEPSLLCALWASLSALVQDVPR